MAEEPDVVLTAGAVATRLGVAVPTLRSWDRRYGLGPSEHQPGRHRRYTSGDLARLHEMVLLTEEGMPPAAAARLAQGQRPDPAPLRDGGGTGALAVGRADREVRGLARAATRLDVRAVRTQVEGHLADRGAMRTWDELLVPLLRSLGERYEQGAEGVVAVEHAATVGFLAALHSLRTQTERGRLPALLACAPEEQHSLPLEALHAALAQRQCPSRFLGPCVPFETVVGGARKVRPRSIVIWAHSARLARKLVLVELAEHCSQLVLCGPGWSGVRAAQEHIRPGSLREAVRAVLEVTPLSHRSTSPQEDDT